MKDTKNCDPLPDDEAYLRALVGNRGTTPRPDAGVRPPPPKPSLRQVYTIARSVLRDVAIDPLDYVEEIKCRLARAGFDYAHAPLDEVMTRLFARGIGRRQAIAARPEPKRPTRVPPLTNAEVCAFQAQFRQQRDERVGRRC